MGRFMTIREHLPSINVASKTSDLSLKKVSTMSLEAMDIGHGLTWPAGTHRAAAFI